MAEHGALRIGPCGLFSSPGLDCFLYPLFLLSPSHEALDLSVRILRLLLQHDVLQCFNESWDSAMEQGPDRPALFPLLHMVFRGNLDLY